VPASPVGSRRGRGRAAGRGPTFHAACRGSVTVVSRSGHGRVTVLSPNNPLSSFTFPNRVSLGSCPRRGLLSHLPSSLLAASRPAACPHSDKRCRNQSPLRHHFDIRCDISLSQCVSARRIKLLAKAREFGFGQSKLMSQLVFGHPLPPSRGERVQTKMSERGSGPEPRYCRVGRARARKRRSLLGNFPPAPFSMNG
jgi:hypothetical protein